MDDHETTERGMALHRRIGGEPDRKIGCATGDGSIRSWQVDLLQDHYLDSLVRLRQRQYRGSEYATRDYIMWQWRENPAGEAIASLAVDTRGQVIGEYWMVPTRFKVAAGEVVGSIGANALVHPEYRRQNIFAALGANCSDHCRQRDVAFTVYVPNRISGQGLVSKFACYNLGTIPLLLFCLDAEQVLAARLDRKWVRRLAGLLVQPAMAVSNRRMKRTGRFPDVVVAGDDSLDAFDDFWRGVKNTYGTIAVRNAEYLRWRYLVCPGREYCLLVTRQGGRITGYLVFRVAEMLGVRAGFIVDFLIDPAPHGQTSGAALVRECVRRCREQGLALVAGLALRHTHEYRGLRECGFLVCPDRVKPHPFNIMLQVHGADTMRAGLRNLTDWYWSLGDYDVL